MYKKFFAKHTKIDIARSIVRKHLEINHEKREIHVLDITVSFDGSWQKRGYKSLYGIGVVMDLLTGLVMDYEILSKYCTDYTSIERDLFPDSPDFSIWYVSHKYDC